MEGGKELGNWPLNYSFQVLWGDIDALNHVNHTVFLKWIETARMNYFSDCGIMELLETDQKGPILASLKIDYLKPVLFPDSVNIRTTITRIGNSSFDMGYRVSSTSNGDVIVAEATVVGVMVNYQTGRPTEIPKSIRERIIEIEGYSTQ